MQAFSDFQTDLSQNSSKRMTAPDAKILPKSQWNQLRSEHRERLGPLAIERISRSGQKHPVYDFLFDYYSFRASHLLRWSPGFHVILQDANSADLDWAEDYEATEDGLRLDPNRYPAHRSSFLSWAIEYLQAIQNREPQLGCFGLHEWAMVYQTQAIRHRQVPLRLSGSETNSLVESSTLRCTHYDAYRFFTEAARPLNRWELSRADMPSFDQPGCVHVNMDVYKFCYKIVPFVPSSLLADAFELAVAARELDMRASPYDLRAWGYDPVPIETKAGREVYVQEQKNLAERGKIIREQLIQVYLTLAEEIQKRQEKTDIKQPSP